MDIRRIIVWMIMSSCSIVIVTILVTYLIFVYKRLKNSLMENRVEPILRPVLDNFILQIERGSTIEKYDVRKLGYTLSNDLYLEYFSSYIEMVSDKIENSVRLAIFIREIPGLIPRVTSNLNSGRPEKRLNSIYMTGLYKYDNEFTTNLIVGNLESKSPYIRASALNSIALMGSVVNMVNSLLFINQTSHDNFTVKCITGALDGFRGDFMSLDSELSSILSRLNEKLRVAVINHFTNVGYKLVAELLYTRIKKINGVRIDNSDEVEIATIKYLTVVKYRGAYSYLLSNLSSNSWVIVAMSIKAIQEYGRELSESVVLKVRDLISHSNTYVRQYASRLLISSIENTEELKWSISEYYNTRAPKISLASELYECGRISLAEYKEITSMS